MDDIFDLEKLKRDQEDAENKKLLLQSVGAVGQALTSTPTAFELLKGKQMSRPDIQGTMNNFAKNVEDPTERQAKLYQAYKSQKEAKELERQSKDQAELDDPESRTSKAYLAFAQSRGMNIEPGMSGRDVLKLMDPKKINEIEASSAIEFDKQKRLKQMEFHNSNYQKNLELENQRKLKEMERNSPSKQFDNLPRDNQELILGLSKKNANKIAIANQIDAVMAKWDELPDEQKFSQGGQLLKTLNSPEGADAIGAEEAKRLGGKLEFALGNFTNSNPMQFGRDLEGFKAQALGTSASIKSGIAANQKLIDQAYGGLNGTSPIYQATAEKFTPPKAKEKGLMGALIPKANANNSSPSVAKKLYNKNTDETKFILTDGTEIVEKGRK